MRAFFIKKLEINEIINLIDEIKFSCCNFNFLTLKIVIFFFQFLSAMILGLGSVSPVRMQVG